MMMHKKKNEIINIVPVDNSNEFIGVKIKKNLVEVYVPNVMRISDDDRIKRRDLIMLLKSINIINHISKETIAKYNNNNNNNNNNVYWPIDSYLWIISDYVTNGLYYSREKKYSLNNGKINWKKTLNRIPIVNGDNIVYTSFVTSKMSPSNDVITQIYEICLSNSVDRVGWLFSFNFKIKVEQFKTVKEMIYIMKKELLSTFDDIKRLRFAHMISILENGISNYSSRSVNSFGIKDYHYIFEFMVDKLLNGIEGNNKKQYYPSGFWEINNRKKELSSNLRPDTIYLKENRTYIFDAKMYKYGLTLNTRDLPKTSSMQKQITYGDFVKNNLRPSSFVRNSFIIPFNKELEIIKKTSIIEYLDRDNNLAYIGKASVNWRNDGDKMDHDNIYTFLIDFNYLLYSYNKDDHSSVDMICSKIESTLK